MRKAKDATFPSSQCIDWADYSKNPWDDWDDCMTGVVKKVDCIQKLLIHRKVRLVKIFESLPMNAHHIRIEEKVDRMHEFVKGESVTMSPTDVLLHSTSEEVVVVDDDH